MTDFLGSKNARNWVWFAAKVMKCYSLYII